MELLVKKIILVFLVFVSLYIPASAIDFTLFGSLEDTINYLNAAAELYDYMGYATYTKIDINKCSFEIVSEQTGVYFCPINASTELYIYTDRYLKTNSILVAGPLDHGKPKKTTYDWSLVAFSCAAGHDLYHQEILDNFYNTVDIGYYEDSFVRIACGPDYENNSWMFIALKK